MLKKEVTNPKPMEIDKMSEITLKFHVEKLKRSRTSEYLKESGKFRWTTLKESGEEYILKVTSDSQFAIDHLKKMVCGEVGVDEVDVFDVEVILDFDANWGNETDEVSTETFEKIIRQKGLTIKVENGYFDSHKSVSESEKPIFVIYVDFYLGGTHYFLKPYYKPGTLQEHSEITKMRDM